MFDSIAGKTSRLGGASLLFPHGIRRVAVFLILLVISSGQMLAQGSGGAILSGVVTDETGSAIPGVTVTVTRTEAESEPEVEVTGMDGDFRIANLRPGTYRIESALDGFQLVSDVVTLKTGQAMRISIELVPAFGETLDVVGEAVQTGEVAVLETRRQSAVVSDSISSEEIRKTPDSDAASVVERLTGVSLIGNKYVFVRGLGERYSGSTINGAVLPTTETEKRVVPLDLFPSKLLETVNVAKTYTPDKPGDFGSGVVELTTTQFPGAASFKVTVGAGYTNATGDSFSSYAGGLDRWGGGGQSLPAAVPTVFLKRRSALDSTGFSSEELETIGEAFIGGWSSDTVSSADPATDFSMTFGNTFGRFGVVLSAVSNHKYDSVDEEQRFFGLDTGDVLVPRNDYDIVTDRESANTGLIANFSARLTDRNQIHLNSVLTRDATSENRYQEGLNTNTGGFIRDYRVRYGIEEIFSNRLRGDHHLGGPGIGSLIDWSIAYSEATNDSDLRENLYRESDDGAFALQAGFAESGKMDFHSLEDEIRQADVAYTAFYAGADVTMSGLVKAGVDVTDRAREFNARRFRFAAPTQLRFDLTASPEEIFIAENIGPGGFEISEVTGVNDAYDAEHTVAAGYLMADATYGNWRVVGGARYEDSDQSVRTFNPFATANQVESVNQSQDVLPSINVVYQTSPQTNLRFAYGRSLNRPEFRELSPFTFVEVTGGRSVAGNPDLEQATLDSYDLRWEWFPSGGEVIAASLFYKGIDKPIERIVQPTTELRTSFVNAESAELWGLELELRKSLEILSPALRWWTANVNYTYINSEVSVGDQLLSVVTNTERPLEGQSDQVANAALQFYQPDWGTMLRVLGSFSGERLTDVGSSGLPDIYESAYTSVDVVLSQTLGRMLRGLELKLAGSNLLDEKREFMQGESVQRSYEPGRTFSLSLGYTPF